MPDPFSQVMTKEGSSISTYVPQIASKYFPFPLLAYNTEHFDNRLLGWNDADKGYKYYDITTDAWRLLRKFGSRNDHAFSKIQYWDLPGHEDKKKDEKPVEPQTVGGEAIPTREQEATSGEKEG